MKKLIYLPALAAGLFLVACGGNPPSYQNNTGGSTINFPSTPPSGAAAGNATNNLPLASPGSETNITTSQQTPTTSPTTVTVPTTATETKTSTAALNPAHGAPGHRCDIPVGAPLNSPPMQQQAAPVQTQTPVNMPQASPQMFPANPTTPVSAPTSGTGRINPPHGEPGHDCSVPVGQPLNN